MSSRPSSFVLTQPGQVRIYSTEELFNLPAPEWLVDDLIPEGGFAVLYGPPGVCKSFLAIDIAMSVAAGGFWHGRRVKQGYVLYVSAEGSAGMGKRIKAWLLSRGLEPKHAPVAWLTEAIPVTADSDQMEILLKRVEYELCEEPTLIIIDTLARCFDGDENQQEDMGRFVRGVDLLRTEFGCAVLIVHHTRLDGERERGNTALRGAADTMLSVTRERGGPVVLTCNKQKDSEEFEDITMRLVAVPETESCVIDWGLARGGLARKNAHTQMILDLLGEHGPMSFTQWRGLTEQAGISPATFKRHLLALREKGEIVRENDIYRCSTPITAEP